MEGNDRANVSAPGRPLANERHETFAVALAESGNQQASYSLAYPEASPEGARAHGSRLAHRPEVLDRVLALRRAKYGAAAAELDDLHGLIAQLALARRDVALDEHGRPCPLHEQPEHVRLALDGVEYKKDGTIKLTFAPITALLKMEAQLRGLLVKRHQHAVGVQHFAPPSHYSEDTKREVARALLARSLPEDAPDYIPWFVRVWKRKWLGVDPDTPPIDPCPADAPPGMFEYVYAECGFAPPTVIEGEVADGNDDLV
ncbi:MAG TPA: hypothetical protein VF329_15230 [Gammaproteobacteria bacterium]